MLLPVIHWGEVMAVSGMENSVLAFLAAVGIAALVWLVAGVLLRGRRAEVPAVLMLPACGNGEALEGWVRSLHEVRGQLGRSTAIAIVDCGLTPEGRHRAEILTRRFGRVTVLQREELEQIVE